MQTYLRPLKTNDNTGMPNDCDDLVNRYNLWRYRQRRNITVDETILGKFEEWKNEEDGKTRGQK